MAHDTIIYTRSVKGSKLNASEHDANLNNLKATADSAWDKADDAQTNKVDKVTSTDNAIARFNGTTGEVQNSNVFVTDDNRLLGGFGAVTTSPTSLDWNAITNRRSGSGQGLLRASSGALNYPPSFSTSSFFHAFNFEHGATKEGNAPITQLAIPYSDSTSIVENLFYRGFYSDVWTLWRQLLSGDANGIFDIRQSTGGIKFPNAGTATAGTETSDVLDWYEEGTFTPVLTSSSAPTPVCTYVSGYPRGRYTRIGDTVTVSIEIRTSEITSVGTGYLRITGLPFVSSKYTPMPLGLNSMFTSASSSRGTAEVYEAGAFLRIIGMDGYTVQASTLNTGATTRIMHIAGTYKV